MLIAGIEKLSLIDYPDNICSVIFTGGCNMYCVYCHNAHLINFYGLAIDAKTVIETLERRKHFVNAVCISGGEPCIQSDITEFIYELKIKGFQVKLDTNGTKPNVLRNLLNNRLLDYIAMDIKAPLSLYRNISPNFVGEDDILESICLLINSNVLYEFRTTFCSEILKVEDIMEIADLIDGAKRYFLHKCKSTNSYTEKADLDGSELDYLMKNLNNRFETFAIRNR